MWGDVTSLYCCPSLQDFHSLATYLSQNTSSIFLDIISDFHLLLFLVTNEVMPLRVRNGEQRLVLASLGPSAPPGLSRGGDQAMGAGQGVLPAQHLPFQLSCLEKV